MASQVSVVHDVLGTVFGLDEPIDEVHTLFEAQLSEIAEKKNGGTRMYAELIVMVRCHIVQRVE